jgi:hypothetical protein
MLMKRYQSRVNNHFGAKYTAQELLSCSPKFFLLYIEFCLRDTDRARADLSTIHLHHVTPVETDPTNKNLWHFSNIMPILDIENLKQGSKRDRDSEQQHEKRVLRFLKTVHIN